MKKVLKIIGLLIVVVIVIGGGAIGYVITCKPNVGKAPDLKIAATPERIKRGEYLANHVSVCIDCHSSRDYTAFSGPLVKGTEGKGGEQFDQRFGFPGVFHAKNITPYGIGKWTDGEVFRAITTGVDKDGNALFPVMPYHYFGRGDTEDIYSIIAYIRTLPSIANDVPAAKPDFPVNIFMHLMPGKEVATKRPDSENTVAYGAYLVNMAACKECHTREDKGVIIEEFAFSGGRQFPLSFGATCSANITPDETGIGGWTREQFVQKFKSYTDTSYRSPKLGEKDCNSIMPWTMYGGMSETDLTAIYEYLRTVKPMSNNVTKYIRKT